MLSQSSLIGLFALLILKVRYMLLQYDYHVWFSLSAALILFEIFSGSFYLLVLSIAFCASGIAAMLGLPFVIQLSTSAFLSIIGLVLVSNMNRTKTPRTDSELDFGQPVIFLSSQGNGMRVRYRGTEWDAEMINQNHPSPPLQLNQLLYIVGTRGSTLLLDVNKPSYSSH